MWKSFSCKIYLNFLWYWHLFCRRLLRPANFTFLKADWWNSNVQSSSNSTKNRTKLTQDSILSVFRSFFGRIRDTIICFRDLLTFRHHNFNKNLILCPLRAILFHSFQYETPCIIQSTRKGTVLKFIVARDYLHFLLKTPSNVHYKCTPYWGQTYEVVNQTKNLHQES